MILIRALNAPYPGFFRCVCILQVDYLVAFLESLAMLHPFTDDLIDRGKIIGGKQIFQHEISMCFEKFDIFPG